MKLDERDLAQLNIKAKAYAKTPEVQAQFDDIIGKISTGSDELAMEAAKEFRNLINNKDACHDVSVAGPRMVDLYTEYCESKAVETWAPTIEKGGAEALVAEDMLDLEKSLAPYEGQTLYNDEIIADIEKDVNDCAEYADFTANALENPEVLEEGIELAVGDELAGDYKEAVNEKAKAVFDAIKKDHPVRYAMYDAKDGLRNVVDDLKIAQENAKESLKNARDSIANAAKSVAAASVSLGEGAKEALCDKVQMVAEKSADIAKKAVDAVSFAANEAKKFAKQAVCSVARASDVIMEKVTFGAYTHLMKKAEAADRKIVDKLRDGGHTKLANFYEKLSNFHLKAVRAEGNPDLYYENVCRLAHGENKSLCDKTIELAKTSKEAAANLVKNAKETASHVSEKFVEKTKELGVRAANDVSIARATVKSATLAGLAKSCELASKGYEKVENRLAQVKTRLEYSVQKSKSAISAEKEYAQMDKDDLTSYKKKEYVSNPEVEKAVDIIKSSSELSSHEKNFALANLYLDEAKAEKKFIAKENRAESFTKMMNNIKSLAIDAECFEHVVAHQVKATYNERKIKTCSTKMEATAKRKEFFQNKSDVLFGKSVEAIENSMLKVSERNAKLVNEGEER